ncbi:MAG TPA: FAD-dependent oxidoreductase [Gammaproteobacteria bacterium]
MNDGRLNIAVIGSGISGLVSAHRLARHHNVTLYEADERVGGHTHTVMVNADDGRHAVDTGFIVFNPENYPLFTRLLDELGVASRVSEMSFSVRDDASGIEWCGCGSLNRIFGQRRNVMRPAFHRMLVDIARFGRDARVLLRDSGDRRSIGEFLRTGKYSTAFSEHYLMPLGAALWSCPEGDFTAFPVRFVAEFLDNHHMLDPLGNRPAWRTVTGGSQRYVDALLKRFNGTLRTGAPVRTVQRSLAQVRIVTVDGKAHGYDEVVIACHADQALRLLEQPTAAERKTLAAFPYTANEAVLHTDVRVLPHSRRTWGAWNVRRHADGTRNVAITYNMNILQGLETKDTWCVTLNDTASIAKERIVRKINYRHPRFTLARDEAQARHRDLIRNNRTSFCGAYWGFGFHEDGVRSAHAVIDAFGMRA